MSSSISVSGFISVCLVLFLSLHVCLYGYISMYINVCMCLSVYVSCLYICLCLSIYLPISPSTSLSVSTHPINDTFPLFQCSVAMGMGCPFHCSGDRATSTLPTSPPPKTRGSQDEDDDNDEDHLSLKTLATAVRLLTSPPVSETLLRYSITYQPRVCNLYCKCMNVLKYNPCCTPNTKQVGL